MFDHYFAATVLDWRTWLALAVLVLTPGTLLRLLVLIYPKGDERRHELVAELYAVPVWRRPVWVLQQMEVIVWEGIPERWYDFAVGRLIYRWKIRSGEKSHEAAPDTFWIPPKEAREDVPVGLLVKLQFTMRDGWGERMWVRVDGRRRRGKYVGMLHNGPIGMPLSFGDRIKFSAADIIDIDIPHGGRPCTCDEDDVVGADCDQVPDEECEFCGRGAPDLETSAETDNSGEE